MTTIKRVCVYIYRNLCEEFVECMGKREKEAKERNKKMEAAILRLRSIEQLSSNVRRYP